jgi:hypothetical protein
MRARLVFIVLLVFLVACQQQEPAGEGSGKVYASSAYLQHFGEPPAVREGFAYAQVGYLPLNDGSAKVRPLPLFLFGENQHLDRILSQLFSDKLIVSSRSKISTPYAQGVKLTELEQLGDTLKVYLSVADTGQQLDQAGLDRAITETAAQFEEINKVQILYDGEPAPSQPVGGYQRQASAIAAVEPPMLLDVVGVWEEGVKLPEEILVNFDRPVAINSFRLLDQSGEQIGGKYFTSIFNMAVVVHPDQPERFKEGMELNVAWDVNDHLGRQNSALDSMRLTRSEH